MTTPPNPPPGPQPDPGHPEPFPRPPRSWRGEDGRRWILGRDGTWYVDLADLPEKELLAK